MSAVFGDTFYFLALFNHADGAHARSVQFAESHRDVIVTTAWVLVEFADAWAKTERANAAAFIEQLSSDPQVRIIPPSQSQLTRGLELYAARPDKEWSLTDCMSFLVMEDEELMDALTADHHFEQAGFTILLK